MNRRSFLKSLGIVCGAAVVVPTALLKAKGEEQNIPCWAAYHKNYNLSERERKELLQKFRKAFKNTKFKPPVFFEFKPFPTEADRIRYCEERGLPA